MRLKDALKADLELVLSYEADKREMEAFDVIVEAARLVANPNIEAARESVDLPEVTLLLWRIIELMGVPVAEFPKKDRTGFVMMIRDAIVNKALFAAALTSPGDTR